MRTRTIHHHLEAYYDFFGRPLRWVVRVVLLLSLIAIPFAWHGPLWTMSFKSIQYPDPLKMSIHLDHLEGQKTPERDDLREINALNHYIGMRPLLESDFAEFLWLPFAVGIFGLLCLRLVVLGRLRDIVDVFVLYIYFGLFSLWDFYQKLYGYGHNLDPEAAITVKPFMPPLYGKEKIANFWVESYPGPASFALAAFGLLLGIATLLALWQTWSEYRRSLRDEAVEGPVVGGLRPSAAAWLLGFACGATLLCKPVQAATLEVGVGKPYPTPAAAIAAASAGDVLHLEGTFRGNLVLDKPVSLEGRPGSRIVGDGIGNVITVSVNGAAVRDLHISGSGSDMMHSDAGIALQADHATVQGCTLTDNLFGIYLRGANYADVQGNSITGREKQGMGSRGAGLHLYDSHNNRICGNRVQTVRDGVYFDHANFNVVEDNQFRRLRYGVHYMYCEANEFYRNTFRDSVAGAAIMYTDGVKFSDNLILSNRQGHNAFGLLFQSCDNCVAERNAIINNTCGFFLEGARDNILRNNLVAYNDTGAVVFGSSARNVFERNDFVENIATLRAIGKPDTAWHGGAGGNYYSDYAGYDLDGDGRGDLPHKLQDAFEYLSSNHPLLQLYLSSAAADALVLAERSFPVLPHSDAEDAQPLTRPCSGVKLDLSSGDVDRPLGSLPAAILALAGWGVCLLGMWGLAR